MDKLRPKEVIGRENALFNACPVSSPVIEQKGDFMTRLKLASIVVFIISLYLLIISSPAIAAMTLETYEQKYKSKEDHYFKMYLSGVGSGYEYMNLYLVVNKMPPVYCAPDNLMLTGDNYLYILDKTIEQSRKQISPKVKIELILLEGLMQTFPCKK